MYIVCTSCPHFVARNTWIDPKQGIVGCTDEGPIGLRLGELGVGRDVINRDVIVDLPLLTTLPVSISRWNSEFGASDLQDHRRVLVVQHHLA